MNIICVGLGFLVVLDALLDSVDNSVSYSQYYVNTASMYNLTSGDNTRSLRRNVFCEFASIAMSRFCSCFITVFSSVISVHSLSVCLSVFSILCWLPCW